jgi:hypothetical protein
LPDSLSLFVAFTEICRARWIRELDGLDTEVNTEAEEHDSSGEEDEEDMILADDGEELDDDSDVLTEEGH